MAAHLKVKRERVVEGYIELDYRNAEVTQVYQFQAVEFIMPEFKVLQDLSLRVVDEVVVFVFLEILPGFLGKEAIGTITGNKNLLIQYCL